ncbi:MAG: hypothetical protein QOG73_1546, partial [Acetobacteraceae bacterium]|nr:hypothetical protein [Acetobacteraceae bacterium]
MWRLQIRDTSPRHAIEQMPNFDLHHITLAWQ